MRFACRRWGNALQTRLSTKPVQTCSHCFHEGLGAWLGDGAQVVDQLLSHGTIKLLAPSCKLIKTYGRRTSQIGNDLHIRQGLNTTSHGKDHSWSCQSQSPAKQFSPGKTGRSAQVRGFFGEMLAKAVYTCGPRLVTLLLFLAATLNEVAGKRHLCFVYPNRDTFASIFAGYLTLAGLFRIPHFFVFKLRCFEWPPPTEILSDMHSDVLFGLLSLILSW